MKSTTFCGWMNPNEGWGGGGKWSKCTIYTPVYYIYTPVLLYIGNRIEVLWRVCKWRAKLTPSAGTRSDLSTSNSAGYPVQISAGYAFTRRWIICLHSVTASTDQYLTNAQHQIVPGNPVISRISGISRSRIFWCQTNLHPIK